MTDTPHQGHNPQGRGDHLREPQRNPPQPQKIPQAKHPQDREPGHDPPASPEGSRRRDEN